MKKVYLDNAATTELDAEVLDVMLRSMKTDYGNPSSSHSFGRKTRSVIETSRKSIADLLNADASEIFLLLAVQRQIIWLLEVQLEMRE